MWKCFYIGREYFTRSFKDYEFAGRVSDDKLKLSVVVDVSQANCILNERQEIVYIQQNGIFDSSGQARLSAYSSKSWKLFSQSKTFPGRVFWMYL